MRIKHSEGASSLVHDGKTIEADAEGYLDVPFELATLLLNQPVWSAEEAQVVVPEAAPVVDPDAEAAAAKAEAEAKAKAEAKAAAHAKAQATAKAKAAAAAKVKTADK